MPNSDGSQKRFLYVGMNGQDNQPINKQLLRQLLPNEKLLKLHYILNNKKTTHAFYSLYPASLEASIDTKTNDSSPKKTRNRKYLNIYF